MGGHSPSHSYEYVTGLNVSDEELGMIDIEYVGPHKGWSYIIRGFKIDS